MGWIRIEGTGAHAPEPQEPQDSREAADDSRTTMRPAVELLCRRCSSCLHCAWRTGDHRCLIHPDGIPEEKLAERRDRRPTAVSSPSDEETHP